jgi:hypothetical protein
VPYKDVNEKLLHLSHLLSIGSPRDTYRQGMLQEEDLTRFDVAQSAVGEDEDMLNNHDDRLEFASCDSCGGIVACDAIALEEESADSRAGQEAVLWVFRACGLTNDSFIAFSVIFREVRSTWRRRVCVTYRVSNCCALTATPRARLKCHFSIHARECKTSTIKPRKPDEM